MHIEPIGDVSECKVVHDESETSDRLEAAVRVMKALAAGVSIRPMAGALELAGGPNRFAAPQLSGGGAVSGDSVINMMAYELGDDDALIIELDPPNPRFWNIQIGDSWSQAIDYMYHQASLSMTQASADDDGKVRIVVSSRDPGVKNWLTPVDSRRGVIIVRWYFVEREALPDTRVVPYAEIDQNLPASTTRVTPEQRAEQLRSRHRAISRRNIF
jgi:hypothetical protein